MYDRRAFAEAVGEPYYPPKGINLTMEIGFWLNGFSDVDREYGRLTALGVKSFSGEPKTFPFGIRNFYVADPEGNLLERQLGERRIEPYLTWVIALPGKGRCWTGGRSSIIGIYLLIFCKF